MGDEGLQSFELKPTLQEDWQEGNNFDSRGMFHRGHYSLRGSDDYRHADHWQNRNWARCRPGQPGVLP